ncbi:MAG: hypothetical protein RMJ84_12875 [Sandaracinaceae bacterium]|nr:hypothetical protein [Sandaracinaceae bacterium]
MSDEKKAKKDLRARLGKTIVPTSSGAPSLGVPGVPFVPPGGAPIPGGVPTDPLAGSAATPGIPAPAPVVPPLGGVGGDVPPPPFAPPASPAPAPRPQLDPFAAQPGAVPAQPTEVRLVIDEKPVAAEEVGKQAALRNLIIVGAVAALLGFVLGAGAGSMNGRRGIYNITVRDGKAIFEALQKASGTVEEAQRLVNRCIEKAGSQPPSVDYEAIKAIQALENPLPAGVFARRNYNAFQPETVDLLFQYYNNVQELWRKFQHLANTTLPDARRQELDRTAQAGGEAATSKFGAVIVPVPEDQGGGYVGQLAFLEPDPQGNPQKMLARPSRGSPGRVFSIFAPGASLGKEPTHVLVIDNQGSRGVLVNQLGAFGQYVGELREIKALVDQTMEIQGRLIQQLSEIAKLEEVFAL